MIRLSGTGGSWSLESRSGSSLEVAKEEVAGREEGNGKMLRVSYCDSTEGYY